MAYLFLFSLLIATFNLQLRMQDHYFEGTVSICLENITCCYTWSTLPLQRFRESCSTHWQDLFFLVASNLVYLPDVRCGKSGCGELYGGGVIIVANSTTSEGSANYIIFSKKGNFSGKDSVYRRLLLFPFSHRLPVFEDIAETCI